MWNYYKSVTVISFPFLNSSCNCNKNSQEKKAKIYQLPHFHVMKNRNNVNILSDKKPGSFQILWQYSIKTLVCLKRLSKA